MAGSKKPEINLEINCGFLRIPTKEVIYNITVLGDEENNVTRVVDKIVQEEKRLAGPAPRAEVQTPPLPAEGGGDDFYRNISEELYHEIGNLAKELSATMQDIPAEDLKIKRAGLDEAGEQIENAKSQLKDIVAMTEQATMEIMDQVEKVQDEAEEMGKILSSLKDHDVFQPGDDKGPAVESNTQERETAKNGVDNDSISELQEILEEARNIISAFQEETVTASILADEGPSAEGPVENEPFSLDPVLQTIYELCTNETVKGHIATARKNAAAAFVAETFDLTLKQKVSEIKPGEDNFIEVPVPDVLLALLEASRDDKLKNLFKRMDATREEIFSVATFPLEAPVSAVQQPDAKDAKIINDTQMPDPRVFELAKLMEGGIALAENLVGEFPVKSEGSGPVAPGLSTESKIEVHDRIENSFAIASQISSDVTRIMELLSFQDISGQQILKIIKLLSDFQMQLMAIVVSFGCRLKSKEINGSITPEESKKNAQADVDAYFTKLNAPDDKESGVLDQEAVNTLLADMGF